LYNLRANYTDPNYLASAIFELLVYAQHPYGMPQEGTPDSVSRLARDDLVRFRDSYYVPDQALLAFAGDITLEAAFAAAEKYLGAWPRTEVASPQIPGPPAPQGL